jgi:hypothetical protein
MMVASSIINPNGEEKNTRYDALRSSADTPYIIITRNMEISITSKTSQLSTNQPSLLDTTSGRAWAGIRRGRFSTTRGYDVEMSAGSTIKRLIGEQRPIIGMTRITNSRIFFLALLVRAGHIEHVIWRRDIFG